MQPLAARHPSFLVPSQTTYTIFLKGYDGLKVNDVYLSFHNDLRALFSTLAACKDELLRSKHTISFLVGTLNEIVTA